MKYKRKVDFEPLEKLSAPDTLEKFVKEIPEKYSNGQISSKLSDQIEKEWDSYSITLKKQKKHFRMKVISISLSIAAAFFLFIGSAFISPVMANVISKIPYLQTIITSKEDIVEIISDELRAKGFNINGVGVSFPGKEINVSIEGSKEYFDTVEEDVRNVVNDILQSKNYDAYTLKVNRYQEHKVETNGEDDKELKEFRTHSTAIHKDLKKRDYNVLSLGMGSNPKTIELEIPNTETRIDEMKQVINHILKTNDIDSIPLNIKKVDMKKREQDDRWREILNVVSEDLLGKKDYKVRMVGYSVHPEPEIQIFTNLTKSDESAKNFSQQLEVVIDDFLKSEQMKPRVKNDPYHIKIFSKDDKLLN